MFQRMVSHSSSTQSRDKHTAVSVGCLAAEKEAVMGTQHQNGAEAKVQPEGMTKVPINPVSIYSLSAFLFLQ